MYKGKLLLLSLLPPLFLTGCWDKKDPEDKDHWLVDEEAAAVVRRILLRKDADLPLPPPTQERAKPVPTPPKVRPWQGRWRRLMGRCLGKRIWDS